MPQYFSALERLQFSQDSDEVDRIYTHYDLKLQTSAYRKHRPARSSPESWPAAPLESDSSWATSFHDKLNRAGLTREEQVSLIKHLRASVIIEAANATRGPPNDTFSPPTLETDHSTAPTLSSRRGSSDSAASAMESQGDFTGHDIMRSSLYDSFRWLDQEEHLDLGLDVDEYHANLRDDVLPQTTKTRRHSFRRHLSISKLTFGRPSMNVSQPASTDLPISPAFEESLPIVSSTQRRLSRTLSVMHPSRLVRTAPIPTIDPTAAHYQDPEARQKLRAYLASPSKFDEAVRYGFSQRPPTSNARGHSRPTQSDDNMRSFLYFDGDEDDGSAHDDASSLSDLDSPKTPKLDGGLTPPPGHDRPTRSPTAPLNQSSSTQDIAVPHKPTSGDSFTQYPPSSRDMTCMDNDTLSSCPIFRHVPEYEQKKGY